MFAKLAFRNVRRQIGNYLIYFITVSLTVALMFAVNGAIFSKELLSRAAQISELRAGLIFVTVLVALIVAFVLGYATSFMLKLRKREFGTYLTLGMTRKNILSVFLLESLILCAASLATGLLLGLLFYQGLMAVVTNLMEMKFAFSAYSAQGLLLTVGLVFSVFALSSLTSAFYLKKVSVYNLIHGEKKVEKKVRFPGVWLGVTLVSLAAVVVSCVFFSRDMDKAMKGLDGSALGLFGWIVVLCVGIIFFHIGAAKSIVHMLMKNRRFKSRGTNVFTLRQLSGKLSADAVMCGALAFLLSAAVIGVNFSFVMKIGTQASVEREYPFDISVESDRDAEQAFTMPQAEEIIQTYVPIEEKLYYSTYTSNNDYLHSFTRWSGEGYGGLYDTFMTESDFNRIYGAIGYAPVRLDGGFMIVAQDTRIEEYDFSSALLRLAGGEYSYAGTQSGYPRLGSYYFFAVIPDEAAAGLSVKSDGAAYGVRKGTYDAIGLREALSYEETEDFYTYLRCDYEIREFARLQANASSAVFIVSALYISVVFVFMAMAILALKTLSGIADDRGRYEVLYRLGANKEEQSRTLFRQIFSFFFLPFALPMLLSIPSAFLCAQLLTGSGFLSEAAQMWGVAGSIALVMAAIYVLYFSAAYLVAKRGAVKE